MADSVKRKHEPMILLVGLLLVATGSFLIYEYCSAQKETAVVCGTDVVTKSVKQLREDINQRIAEQTDRINARLDFIAGWREPRYK